MRQEEGIVGTAMPAQGGGAAGSDVAADEREGTAAAVRWHLWLDPHDQYSRDSARVALPCCFYVSLSRSRACVHTLTLALTRAPGNTRTHTTYGGRASRLRTHIRTPSMCVYA